MATEEPAAQRRPLEESPLALERWAVVLRRHRIGYRGYEQVDPGARAFERRRREPTAPSLLDAGLNALRRYLPFAKGRREQR